METLLIRYKGIFFYVLSTVFFSAMNVAIRSATTSLDPLQMVFLRNSLSFLLLLPFVLHRGAGALKTERFGRHAARAAVGIVAMESWFYALMHMNVNTATALSFTAPLFSTLFAVLFLGETIGRQRIAALLTGFAGVLIIADPFAGKGLTWYTLIILGSASLMAVSGTLVKTLTRTEPGWRIVFYMSLLMSLISLPLALPVWRTPDAPSLAKAAMIAGFATAAQLCLARALASEKIVILAPFEFMRLIFTALLSWAVCRETVTPRTVLGSVIIVGAAVFIAWREAFKRRSTLQMDVLQ